METGAKRVNGGAEHHYRVGCGRRHKVDPDGEGHARKRMKDIPKKRGNSRKEQIGRKREKKKRK